MSKPRKLSWPPIRWRQMLPRTHRSAGVLCAILMLGLWLAPRQELQAHADSWHRQDILDALRWVESSNRDDVPDGDNGRAIGPYQIHRVYWLDATGFDKAIGGNYQDCRKRAYAERIIDAYMRRYAASAWQAGDAERIARVHNGGPKGHEKAATADYWQRVKNRLPSPHGLGSH